MPAARWRSWCRKDRAAQLNPTVRKVAAGAAETTPVATVTNLSRSLKLLKDAGLWIVGADMAGRQAGLGGRPHGAAGLVLGGEGDGPARAHAPDLRFPGAAAAGSAASRA